jgi:polyisoprenoid-binding protein YceI
MVTSSGSLATTASEAAIPARVGPLRLTAHAASVEFTVRFLHAFPIRGRFDAIEGELVYDARRPGEASLVARLDVASIATGNRLRDAHLRSTAWFDATRYPHIELRATRFDRDRDGVRILAVLALRGREAPVEIVCAMDGQDRPALTGRLIVARSTFGLGPPDRRVAPWDPRAYLVDDDVSVELRLRTGS